MPIRIVHWPAVAVAATALLVGCTGEPRTFYTAKPIVLEPRPAARAPARPVRAAPGPVLSLAEKEQLFQKFRRLQRLKDQTVTTIEAPP